MGGIARHFIKHVEAEGKRQGLTKADLARKSGVPGPSLRRILLSRGADMKMSTFQKLAAALGTTIDLRKVDDDVPPEHRSLLMEKIRRRNLAERLAVKNNLDAGDIEHSLYNLTLRTTERVARRFHGRHVPQ
jgi:transcriptional regulator with XRE-family HTH domain